MALGYMTQLSRASWRTYHHPALCLELFPFGSGIALVLVETERMTPRKRILIADDKPEGRELVRTVLENTGFDVHEAADGIEALSAAHRLQPHLIILDLHMPGLDGFGVIKELRAHPAFCDTPVMALTASAMQGDRARALAAGFTGYLAKPVSLKALRSEVVRLLA